MKPRRAIHAIPIGQRNRRHLQLHRALNQLFRQRRSRQKTECAGCVQLNVFICRSMFVTLSGVTAAAESKDLRLFLQRSLARLLCHPVLYDHGRAQRVEGLGIVFLCLDRLLVFQF